ncbi:MAG: iron-sulfur cluster assembly accessory protein [Verrucomicrobia bacterium]|nr:iron-sulfur cluster assembly accessory protein [Verrucomicrobiota bacterium]|tara:strand:- start:79 stop:396 length:318 start_codon:yes stop_codon:yes gene_type:complete
MISLTESAANKIRSLQQENGVENEYMRLSVEPGGCSGMEYAMSFASRDDEDEVIESHGVQVIVDAVSLTYLEGTEVHFDDGLHGKGFEIRNPNAQNTCGCGRSFS